MNIKIHSSEMNRMMKTITQCIDPRDPNKGNVEVIYDNNLLTVRGTNGVTSAMMSTPLLGGDGESFCVDGTMFARVCAMCSGEISVSTDGKVCTVKGAGRTRIPVVKASIPAFEPVKGKECKVKAEAFARGYSSVSYAISADQSRVVLTGVLVESMNDGITMVSLDGFKMAVESIPCESEQMRIVIPGQFMKLVSASTVAGEVITIRTDGKRVQAETDCMKAVCVLLSGDFPDYKRIVPADFRTSTLVNSEAIQGALKSGSVVNSSNNLVKLKVTENDITVMSNSEQADFDAEVSCATNGEDITIAFNHKFLMETINSIGDEEITFRFNTPISPCIISRKDTDGYRLILPVRVAG